MADFAPPSGPPPPKVPEGFKAVWNNEYKEWFYVNIYTKKSQWDKPTEPVHPPDSSPAPPGPPPGYGGGSGSASPYSSDRKANPYDAPDTESDAALAARLQAEENARVSKSRDAQSDYQNTPMPSTSSYDQALPPREKSAGGFLNKLFHRSNGSGSGRPQQYGGSPYPGQQGGYPQQGYGYQAQPAPYPPQGYQQQQYGGYPPQGGYGGGYGGGYAQPAAKQSGGGLGTMGGAALGLGGGLVGGMLLEDAIQDHDQNEYDQGYQQGEDNNNNNGGYDDNGGGDDYGGGDDGGGDF